MQNKLLRKLYAKFLPKILRYPNVHLGLEHSRKLTLPFCGNTIVIRRSKSDVSRVCEYINEIYTPAGYLHNSLLKSRPTVLVDVGANIGLSTLALLQKFPSIVSVVGIEAEPKNFGVLEQNFLIWSDVFPNVSFRAINAVASSQSGSRHTISVLSSDPTLTASGTFRFEQNRGEQNGLSCESLAISSLLKNNDFQNGILMKVDIEGGEEYLFAENTEWLKKVAFLTIELHDRYDRKLIQTSTNVIKSLIEHDFAVQPSEDVLHCYNRKIFANK